MEDYEVIELQLHERNVALSPTIEIQEEIIETIWVLSIQFPTT